MDMQVKILEELIVVTEGAGIPIWFYGGYALDALEGKPIRPHGDIDFFRAQAGYHVYDPTQSLRNKDAEDLNIICQRILPGLREKLTSLFNPFPGTRKRYLSDNNA